MITVRRSTLLLLMGACGMLMETFGPPPLPEVVNRTISVVSFVGFVMGLTLFTIQHLQRSAGTNGENVVDDGNSNGILNYIITHQYFIVGVVGVISFIVAVTLWTTKSASDIDTARVFTPRTPKEIIDIARTKTKRDAMRYKGDWIHVEGTVENVSEVHSRGYSFVKKPYIELEVVVGSLHDNRTALKVELYVDADKWKSQTDKIERGDRLVAIGTVHDVYIFSMRVTDGEIISVSGSEGDRQ